MQWSIYLDRLESGGKIRRGPKMEGPGEKEAMKEEEGNH